MVKRILHVITTIDRGGAENQLLALTKAQVLGGDAVLVIPLKGNNELKEDFKKYGIGVYTAISNKNLIKQMQGIHQKFIEFGPDVVHAHLPRAELVMACLPLGVPLLVSRHNSENFFPHAPHYLSRFLSRFVGFRAKQIIFISQCAKKYSLAKKEILESKKITVIYYGIEGNNVLKKKRKTNVSKDSLIRFVTVGRLVEQKDLATQIRAVNRLRNQNILLEIIGDGELREELQTFVNAMNLKEKVRFVGRTAYVIEALRGADCFILSSKYEGFGLVILEALFSQIPVIASDIPTTREILGNEYPYLFKVGDDEKLSELMHDVVIGAINGPKHDESILKQFDIEKTRKQTDDVYCQALETFKNE